MGTLSKQLKKYLANRTPEQLAEDKKLLDKWKNIGPALEEYFRSLN